MKELITSEDPNSPDLQEEKDGARKHIATLFDTKKYFDVTFVVKDVEFRAHTSVLSRYDYFDSMFSNWEGGKQSRITINDIVPAVFNIMLEFIYKGRISDRKEKLEAHSVDVIEAADLYGIDGLRKNCEKYLIHAQKINVETACEYFIMADKHNAPQLKATTTKFISKNLEEVRKTNGYVELKRYNLTALEAIETLSPSKRPRLLD